MQLILKDYFKLLRIKNYIKNFLIFIPFIFSGKFLINDVNIYILSLMGFLLFSFSSSIIYIINDIVDKDKDKLDDHKKNRPIASGRINIRSAKICIAILTFIVLCLMLYIKNTYVILTIIGYIILNILYSIKLKNIPILDILVLSTFFLIRIIYSGFLYNVPISIYLYLTTLSVSFYLGIGKRKKELEKNKNIREVLNKYSTDFLNNILSIFLGLSILYYSLWIINVANKIFNHDLLNISIFLVVGILLYYHYILYYEDNGNPVDIFFKHKLFIFLIILYIVIIGFAFVL